MNLNAKKFNRALMELTGIKKLSDLYRVWYRTDGTRMRTYYINNVVMEPGLRSLLGAQIKELAEKHFEDYIFTDPRNSADFVEGDDDRFRVTCAVGYKKGSEGEERAKLGEGPKFLLLPGMLHVKEVGAEFYVMSDELYHVNIAAIQEVYSPIVCSKHGDYWRVYIKGHASALADKFMGSAGNVNHIKTVPEVVAEVAPVANERKPIPRKYIKDNLYGDDYLDYLDKLLHDAGLRYSTHTAGFPINVKDQGNCNVYGITFLQVVGKNYEGFSEPYDKEAYAKMADALGDHFILSNEYWNEETRKYVVLARLPEHKDATVRIAHSYLDEQGKPKCNYEDRPMGDLLGKC